MESTSKIRIERETLGEIAHRHLGKGLVSSHEIEDGWFNTIHVLELEGGGKAVLKVSPPPAFTCMRYEADIIKVEVAVHRALAAAGLRVPAILAESPSGDLIGHPWFIMEWLEGVQLKEHRKSLPKESLETLDREVARQSAKVNALTGPRFGRWLEDGTASTSWAESFSAMMEDVFSDARDMAVRLPRPEGEIRALVEAARPALDLVKEARLVLWDLHDGNVIVREDPPSLVGFLDTDRAVWGDPLFEFYFRKISGVSPAWRSAYEEAAREAGFAPVDADEGAKLRKALYEAYLALIMVVESKFRAYTWKHEAIARLYCASSLRGLRKEVRKHS